MEGAERILAERILAEQILAEQILAERICFGACPVHHIGTVAARGTFQVRTAGRVIELTSAGLVQANRAGKRGRVVPWSGPSRGRMVKTLEALEWSGLGRLLWVGLTYPAVFPSSGKEAKAHLKAFSLRWLRKWGQPRGPWKLEFQRRGAPHFHLVLAWPENVSLSGFRLWLSTTWFEVVGSGDLLHLAAGTSCEEWRGSEGPGGYFAAYGTAKSKDYQNVSPPGWLTGRWWGLWGVKPTWQVEEVARSEFVRLRRILRALRRSRPRTEGKRIRYRPGLAGMWLRGGRVPGELARQLGLLTAKAARASKAVERKIGQRSRRTS